jgi:hypothetical protein
LHPEVNEMVARQAWLETPTFAAWYKAKALAGYGHLLPRAERDAEVARLEGVIAATELELEELDVDRAADELKQRRASLAERAAGVLGRRA